MRYSKHFMNPKIENKVYKAFIDAIKNSKSSDDLVDFLNDLLSQYEKSMLAKRVAIAFMLLEDKYSYENIITTLKVSDGTVAKVRSTLVLQGKGYRKTIGNLLLRKSIKNALSEFLDMITPDKRALTSEKYLKPKIESKKKRNIPL